MTRQVVVIPDLHGRADLLAHNATGPVYRYVGLGGGRWATRGTLLGALPSGVTLA